MGHSIEFEIESGSRLGNRSGCRRRRFNIELRLVKTEGGRDDEIKFDDSRVVMMTLSEDWSGGRRCKGWERGWSGKRRVVGFTRSLLQ